MSGMRVEHSVILENFKKDLTTSLFCLKCLCLLGVQRVRCSSKRSLNTSLNRSLFLLVLSPLSDFR